MYKLRRNLHTFWMVCGVIITCIGLAQCQQPLQNNNSNNGTLNAQSSNNNKNNNNRAAKHQQPYRSTWSAYDVASSIPAIGRYQQQTNGTGTSDPISYTNAFRGRKNSFNELRENLSNATQQAKYWERQSDDPGRLTNKTNPIREIAQKIFQSDRKREELQDTNAQAEEAVGIRCDFETECVWQWDKTQNDTFQVVTGSNITDANLTGMMPGPSADNKGDPNGYFLHLRLTPSTSIRTLKSPTFSTTRESCRLEMYAHQNGNKNGKLRIVIEPVNSYDTTTASSWVPIERDGNDDRKWTELKFPIGRVSQDFRILFEVVPKGLRPQQRAHVSIDNLRMRACFSQHSRTTAINGECPVNEVKCKSREIEVCIKPQQQCDINIDCDNKEDELLNCEKIPFGGRCDFENGWCGWQNSGKAIMIWERHSGPTPTEKTGPDNDHTFENFNSSGHYLFVNMNQHFDAVDKKKLSGFASNAVINSIIFNPPPYAHLNASSTYRHSCKVRFYVHQFGKNAGSLNLSVVEIHEKENITSTLWWSSRELGNEWKRIEIVMPNITSRYYLQFEARQGMRIFSDVAIDDFSLSPECFGLNIALEHLQGYNYYDQRILQDKTPHEDFANRSVIELSTCNTRGKEGPSAADCHDAYNNTDAQHAIHVIEDQMHKGVQVWRVPSENYYTIIAKGAGGGLGSRGIGSSRGALAVSVFELHKDEDIYILVGQQGEHACVKSFGYRDKECEPKARSEKNNNFYASSPSTVGGETYSNSNNKATNTNSKTKQVKNFVIEEGAGGGGGGTYIYLLNSANVAVPLLVAGGGGGLGIGPFTEDDMQHGRIYESLRIEVSGQRHGEANITGGAGGGWRASADHVLEYNNGASLLEGGRGGEPCFTAKGIRGQGGFGGGGGGCRTGGGGGGYSGGDTFKSSANGEGGTSYIGKKRSIAELSAIYAGDNIGHGSVVIVPAIPHPACGCDYRCVVLDEFSVNVRCICPDGWRLKKDNQTACEPMYRKEIPMEYLIIFFAVVTILLIAALAALIFILYNRYQRKKQIAMRHKVLKEQDLQLSRLRHNPEDQQQSNFNPNYGNDCLLNGGIDVKNLPQVARESLRLVKALGQGAFGEVYQGLYRHRDGDAVEMPVAVKTLPEMSTGQAEADFLMEAAIMAKFKHANIVHLIGVCFDRHPRFIVLELLAGGDLKNFLREGRHKPERPSPLTMKDLIFCAIDVARGCRYMESKRFIHRDIAARNCLLSSKGPGRVVKIADFGMARDIYRSDYYRKGGKAMLPIKWMPPEAFLDGIFTSKTDVWSFGVLLWEVFSMGLMPYTGLPNRDVMQLVTSGGRLDTPSGCPPYIYTLMSSCWHPVPDARPGFQYLLDTLQSYTLDDALMKLQIPNFFRPPSSERDQTIMRPPNDEFCLQVPNSSDYLIPLPDSRTMAERTIARLLSEGTGITLSETMTSCTAPMTTSPSAPKTLTDCWETSFATAQSNQTLSSHLSSSIDDKLISLDTPLQTPTTIKPPISMFRSDLSPTSNHNQYMDGNGNGQASSTNNNNHNDNGGGNSPKPPYSSSNNINKNKIGISNGPITLDPSALDKQGMSYANVRMMNISASPSSNAQSDGSTGSNTTNVTGNNNDIVDKTTSPFTIQGYSDRYTSAKENHSEISC